MVDILQTTGLIKICIKQVTSHAWNNGEQDLWHHMAAIGQNELTLKEPGPRFNIKMLSYQ